LIDYFRILSYNGRQDSIMRHSTTLLLCCLLGLWPGTLPLADESADKARQLRASGQILSLEKLLEVARKIKPGEILETELDKEAGRYVYEIDILDAQGRVWELKLDAKDGKLIELEKDH